MKTLRVLMVTAEGLIPPAEIESVDMVDTAPWKMEYDLQFALERLEHEQKIIAVYDNLSVIRETIESFNPHVVFNLVHEFHGVAIYDSQIAGYLELLKQAYTGCNPRGLMLSRDKVLAKKLLLYHRIATPRFQLYSKRRKFRAPSKMHYPLIVKSATEEASLGISQASIVHSEEKLKERVEFIFESIGSDALVEEYIEGRELYVGVLGNNRLEVFPPIEIEFSGLPEGSYPIATRKVKWDMKYRTRHNIVSRVPQALPEASLRSISSVAKKVYKTLFLSGYARLDCRLTADGTLYVLEANANPDLSMYDEFALTAERAGYSYEQLVQRVLTLGLGYTPEWKKGE